MNPQVQIEHRDVGPNVAHLLLSSVPDFFDVMKILLDRRAISKGFDNFAWRCFWIGTEKELAAMCFFHNHHSNHAPCRFIGCEKGFHGFRDPLPVNETLDSFPTQAMRSVGSQIHSLGTVLTRLPGTAFLDGLRHGEQLRVLAQPTDHGHAGGPLRLDERSIGIRSVDDDPDGFFCGFGQFRELDQLLCRQLQLSTEFPFISAWKLADIFRTHIHQSQQR